MPTEHDPVHTLCTADTVLVVPCRCPTRPNDRPARPARARGSQVPGCADGSCHKLKFAGWVGTGNAKMGPVEENSHYRLKDTSPYKKEDLVAVAVHQPHMYRYYFGNDTTATVPASARV